MKARIILVATMIMMGAVLSASTTSNAVTCAIVAGCPNTNTNQNCFVDANKDGICDISNNNTSGNCAGNSARKCGRR